MAKVNVGDIAPSFTLPDERGQSRSLASALGRGPVVLIFYPMDNTPGCKAQLCAVRDDSARYAKAGITVYAINNGGAESHQGFKSKNGFTAPLLVDRNLVVATQYDAAFGFGPVRLINRTVVGIARDGRIAFYKRGSPATDEILVAFATPAAADVPATATARPT
jgi:peroxiredoxin Q/BCP